MKLSIALSIAFIAAQTACLAQSFQVGERVFVESINQYGVVTEVSSGGAGGSAVNVKLDRGGELMFDANHLRPGGPAGNAEQGGTGGGAGGFNQTPNFQNPTPGAGAGANPTGQAGGKFNRGDRVFIQSINQYGTVLESTGVSGVGGSALNVRLDKSGGSVMFDPSSLQHTNNGQPNLDTRILPWSGPGAGGGGAGQNQAQPASQQQLQGAGMPPSGQYTGVYTIDTTIMPALGMRLSGNRYTAGTQTGTISMGPGGRLSFSNGLGGLEGCKIQYGIYVPVGPLANHPTIEVFFTTPGGNGSQIDYSLE